MNRRCFLHIFHFVEYPLQYVIQTHYFYIMITVSKGLLPATIAQGGKYFLRHTQYDYKNVTTATRYTNIE